MVSSPHEEGCYIGCHQSCSLIHCLPMFCLSAHLHRQCRTDHKCRWIFLGGADHVCWVRAGGSHAATREAIQLCLLHHPWAGQDSDGGSSWPLGCARLHLPRVYGLCGQGWGPIPHAHRSWKVTLAHFLAQALKAPHEPVLLYNRASQIKMIEHIKNTVQ